MAKFLVILAITVVSAYSAVVRSDDATLKRIARSPHYSCEDDHHDHGPPFPPGHFHPFGHGRHGPPPPPPGFHAQQWTGYLRNSDGSQQGIFSGAAAAAQADTQASGQAYTLNYSGSGSAAKSSDIFAGNAVSNQNNLAKTTQDSQANAAANSGQPGGFGNIGATSGGYSGGYGSQFNEATKSGAYSEKSGGYGSQVNSGGFAGHSSGSELKAAAESSAFSKKSGVDGNQANAGASSADFIGHATGYESQANRDANAGRFAEQSGSHGNQAAGGSAQNSGSYGNQVTAGESSISSGHQSAQPSLHGAVDLASQGLQGAQEQAGASCSTCGKNSYAVSSAKSHNGNAVAVSVSG